MSSQTRPDAITRAQMPPSSRGNPATPVIIGIIAVLFFFLLLFFFMGVIPFEAVKGGEKESKQIDRAVNLSESRAMKNLDNTGSLYPNESGIPVQPDPILSPLEQPFAAEEEQEEMQIDR